jgi:hypothetical protein
MPELTITSPYVHSRIDSNTFTMGNPMPCRVDLNPMPESTLSPSQGLRIWPLKFASPVPGVAVFSWYFAWKNREEKFKFFSFGHNNLFT